MYELVYELRRDKLNFKVELRCRVGLQCDKLLSDVLPRLYNDPSTPVYFYAADSYIAKLEEAIGSKCHYYDNMNVVRKDVLESKVRALNKVQNNLKELLISYGWFIK